MNSSREIPRGNKYLEGLNREKLYTYTHLYRPADKPWNINHICNDKKSRFREILLLDIHQIKKSENLIPTISKGKQISFCTLVYVVISKKIKILRILINDLVRNIIGPHYAKKLDKIGATKKCDKIKIRKKCILTLNRKTSSIRAFLPSLTHDWKKLGATETPSASLVIPVWPRSELLAITRNVPKSSTRRRCV